MKELVVVIFFFLSLSACSFSMPIHGQIQKTQEPFMGKITASINQSGNLMMFFSNTTCKGSISPINREEALGTLSCNDGRIGSFRLISVGMQITGVGQLNGEFFTFQVGQK